MTFPLLNSQYHINYHFKLITKHKLGNKDVYALTELPTELVLYKLVTSMLTLTYNAKYRLQEKLFPLRTE